MHGASPILTPFLQRLRPKRFGQLWAAHTGACTCLSPCLPQRAQASPDLPIYRAHSLGMTALGRLQWDWRLQPGHRLDRVKIEGALVHILVQAQRGQRVAHDEAHDLPRHLVCALIAAREGRLRLWHSQEAAQHNMRCPPF